MRLYFLAPILLFFASCFPSSHPFYVIKLGACDAELSKESVAQFLLAEYRDLRRDTSSAGNQVAEESLPVRLTGTINAVGVGLIVKDDFIQIYGSYGSPKDINDAIGLILKSLSRLGCKAESSGPHYDWGLYL